MTYIVTSSHHETLKSGRLVYPGQEISDKEAEANPRLVDRGALTKHQEAAPEPPPANPTPPAPPEAKPSPAPPSSSATEPAPAQKSTPRSSGRQSKAPAESVPNKED